MIVPLIPAKIMEHVLINQMDIYVPVWKDSMEKTVI